jgi:hypothetical protein
MDTEILITVIGAAFTIISPIVIQWRKQPEWSKLLRVGLPVLVSLAIAVAYLLLTGALAGLTFLAAFLIVYGLQQLVYSTILKNLTGLLGNDGRHEATAEDGYPIPGPHEPTEADPERYEH